MPTADARLSQPGFSVRDLAKRWRIGRGKVLGYIRRGELCALNLADAKCSRPLFRVTPEAVAAFEAGRSAAAPPRQPHRKRKQTGIDFFPD